MSDNDLIFAVFNEIGIIDQLASAEFQKLLAPHLGVSEFSVLNHFVRVGDGKTPSWLAKAFQMTKPSMTAIIAKLSAKGYVTVTPGEADKRQKFVHITKAGRAAREDALKVAMPMAQKHLAGFGPDRLRAILPILAELRTYLDAARNVEDGLDKA